MDRVLRKSRSNMVLTGLCGGIADYFGLKASHLRVAWVLLTLLGKHGHGLLLYIALAIIIPSEY